MALTNRAILPLGFLFRHVFLAPFDKGFDGRVLIKDLSFTLPRNGIVGVIGPNGVGKTTLFKTIVGLEEPDSGVVKVGTTALSGVSMKLTSPTPAGFAPRSVTTSSTGAYSFTGLPAGRNYTVTPTKAGYQFTQASKSITNLSANQTTVNFQVKVYIISGQVTHTGTTTGIGSVTMTLTSPTPAGFAARTVQTTSAGYYTFANVPAGRNYTIKPTKSGFTFSPVSRSFSNLSSNIPRGASTSFAGTP